jgi:hypothetical protein
MGPTPPDCFAASPWRVRPSALPGVSSPPGPLRDATVPTSREAFCWEGSGSPEKLPWSNNSNLSPPLGEKLGYHNFFTSSSLLRRF